MATYRATADWTLAEGEDFATGRYSRGHSVVFGSGFEAPGTASPHIVGNKWSVAGAVDPEEMLVGAITTCHMLSFLHVAREAGFTVTRYRDEAVGIMEKNADGELWVSKVTLHPEIRYQGRHPTPAERDHLHHAAHQVCFIANSVKTEIVVEEVVGADG
ncbi:MAG: putative redox protein regulator of disulfide bond formation [Phenylobacterium sp.]|uniref:OsmC family protein n=1 Tax=Phenylobacterium sp. TaxID=1871053 RepID=UPI00260FC3E8|nr:OsmC family protein [Phenylobacterium sp.]MDB5464153.1 putative redox protein regulator of disulfide bond formation [Phenylobacterium sp.]MDB5498985.1 putative redox protein regulator of disulfide bond formation [Phenylobacterium sp.]